MVAAPKVGLKFWTGLLSGADDVAAAEVVVVVTEKMGLKPEASRGLVLLAEPLAGAVAAAETGSAAEEAVGVPI